MFVYTFIYTMAGSSDTSSFPCSGVLALESKQVTTESKAVKHASAFVCVYPVKSSQQSRPLTSSRGGVTMTCS